MTCECRQSNANQSIQMNKKNVWTKVLQNVD